MMVEVQRFVLIIKRFEGAEPLSAEEVELTLTDCWPMVSSVARFKVLDSLQEEILEAS